LITTFDERRETPDEDASAGDLLSKDVKEMEFLTIILDCDETACDDAVDGARTSFLKFCEVLSEEGLLATIVGMIDEIVVPLLDGFFFKMTTGFEG
jgi:hypothetical protein